MKTFYIILSSVIFTTVNSLHLRRRRARGERTPRSTDTCTDGYTALGAYCYKLFTDKKNWDEANTACENNGSKLAQPKSQPENAAVNYFMKANTAYFQSATDLVWLGGDDKSTEKEWLWGQEKVTWTKWERGKPNGGRAKNCMVMSMSEKWQDMECSFATIYACQHKPKAPTTPKLASTLSPEETSSTDTTVTVLSVVSALSLIWCIFDAALSIKRHYDDHCRRGRDRNVRSEQDATTSEGNKSSEKTSSSSGKASSEGMSSKSSGSSDGTSSSKNSHTT